MPTLLISLTLTALMAGQSGTASEAPAPATAVGTAIATQSKHTTETVHGSDADEKVTCRNERQVGSNMIKRVCKSAAERKRDTQQARDVLQNSNRGGG